MQVPRPAIKINDKGISNAAKNEGVGLQENREEQEFEKHLLVSQPKMPLYLFAHWSRAGNVPVMSTQLLQFESTHCVTTYCEELEHQAFMNTPPEKTWQLPLLMFDGKGA